MAGASSLEPVYLGAKNQPVRDAVENALRSVESGEKSSDEGWDAAVEGRRGSGRLTARTRGSRSLDDPGLRRPPDRPGQP